MNLLHEAGVTTAPASRPAAMETAAVWADKAAPNKVSYSGDHISKDPRRPFPFLALPFDLQRRALSDANVDAVRAFRLSSQAGRALGALRKLKLNNAADLRVAIERFPEVNHLDLARCGSLGDDDLAYLSRLEWLESLDLPSSPHITNEGFAHLSEMRRLKRLHAGRCAQLTDAGLAGLVKLTTLTHLDVASCPEVSDTGLAHLRALRSLEHLGLSHCPRISDNGIQSLALFEALRSLDLSGAKHLTNSGLAQLCANPQLRHLVLSLSDIRDCSGLLGLHHLRKLELNFCWNLASLDGLEELSKLEHLELKGGTWSGESLQRLAALPRLEYLDLFGCKNVQNVTALKDLARLRYLSLRRCRKLSDIQGISKLQHLEHLNLFECSGLTDEGLVIPQAFSISQRLSLYLRPRLTDEGKLLLQQALPDTRIEFEPSGTFLQFLGTRIDEAVHKGLDMYRF